MKLEVKYLFPTSYSGVNFYIHQLPEDLGMREILAHGTTMQKNPQTRAEFSGFLRILMELCGSKGQFAPLLGNLINGVANPEIVYIILYHVLECVNNMFMFFICCINFK